MSNFIQFCIKLDYSVIGVTAINGITIGNRHLTFIRELPFELLTHEIEDVSISLTAGGMCFSGGLELADANIASNWESQDLILQIAIALQVKELFLYSSKSAKFDEILTNVNFINSLEISLIFNIKKLSDLAESAEFLRGVMNDTQNFLILVIIAAEAPLSCP